MTTELVLLLSLALFIIGGVFKSPPEVFREAAPNLGARVEVHLTTGSKFIEKARKSPQPIGW